MNYYILPKNNINVKINIVLTDQLLNKNPFISQSIAYFLHNIHTQLYKIDKDQSIEDYIDYNMNIISKIVNTYEFIYTQVPGSCLSVSKVKAESNIFYELLELFHICNISESFVKNEMLHLHISSNYNSSTYFLNILREECNDIHFDQQFNINQLYEKYVIDKFIFKIDFLFFEIPKEDYNDINKYTQDIIFILYIILKYQNYNGTSIIKLDHLIYKSEIDVLYILSCVFEKVSIVKPLVTNIISGERFIVCKQFDINININTIIIKLEECIHNIINNNLYIESIIQNDIPYLFTNKIEESNIVIAQQQLESIDQIINIIKNKNKDDKIETLKKNHIQKCIQWCEKFRIPHNKFIDKLNIFLNTNIIMNPTKSNRDKDTEMELFI